MTKENNKRPANRIFARLGLAGIALAATLGIAACGGDQAEGGGDGSVALVAYSTPQQLYEEGIIPAFEDTPDGEGADFSTSFGSSGDQSRAVEAGQGADYVSFSLEPDMERLVEAGIVAPDWSKGQFNGNVSSGSTAGSSTKGCIRAPRLAKRGFTIKNAIALPTSSGVTEQKIFASNAHFECPTCQFQIGTKHSVAK